MEQSPPSEADYQPGTPGTPRLLCSFNVYYRVQQSLIVILTLIQTILVHILPSFLLETLFSTPTNMRKKLCIDFPPAAAPDRCKCPFYFILPHLRSLII
jgi:hypothetical protein